MHALRCDHDEAASLSFLLFSKYHVISMSSRLFSFLRDALQHNTQTPRRITRTADARCKERWLCSIIYGAKVGKCMRCTPAAVCAVQTICTVCTATSWTLLSRSFCMQTVQTVCCLYCTLFDVFSTSFGVPIVRTVCNVCTVVFLVKNKK